MLLLVQVCPINIQSYTFNSQHKNKIQSNKMNNNNQNIPVRAVVLGDKGSGKSTFMAQICDSYINENLEYERKITDPKLDIELLVQFTDHPEELASAKVSFIVIDLSSKDSFEVAKNSCYPKAVSEMPKDAFVYLVGNKADLEDKRQVDQKEVAQFASEKCVAYTEVCCLVGKKKGIDVVQRMFKYRLTNIIKASKVVEQQKKSLENSFAKDSDSMKENVAPVPEADSAPELPPRENSELENDSFAEIPQKPQNESNIMFHPSDIAHEPTVEQETKDENQILLQQLNDNKPTEILDYSDPTFSQYSSVSSYQTSQANNITLNPQLEKPTVNTSLDPLAPSTVGMPSATPQFQSVNGSITPERLEEREEIVEEVAESEKFMNACQPYKSPFRKSEMYSYEDLPVPEKVAKSRNLCKTPVRSRNNQDSALKTEMKDQDFLEKLDEDVKRSAETLKLLNRRYNQRTSPNIKKTRSVTVSENQYIIKRQSSDAKNAVPIFETSLVENDLGKGVLRESRNKVNAAITAAASEPAIKRFEKFQESKSSKNKFFIQPLGSHANEKENENGNCKLKAGHIRQTGSLLTLEITLKPGTTILLDVTKSDSPTYLAEKCLSLGGIKASRTLINTLASVIEEKVGDEIRRLLDSIKKERMRIMHEKTVCEKTKKAKELEKMKPFDLSTEKRQCEKENKPKIIGRLSILIGNNKTGEIVVREGDSPEMLTQNFIATYSLKSHTFPTILDALQKLIASYRNNRQSNEGKSPIKSTEGIRVSAVPHFSRNEQMSSSSSSVSSLGGASNDSRRSTQKFLFRVNFTLLDGRKASIAVREKDNLYRLAHNFVVTHKLKEDMVGRVWGSLQESYKVSLFLANNSHQKHLEKTELDYMSEKGLFMPDIVYQHQSIIE
eukprot:TRINITY_DN752_c0_g1_i1.p1 TRINITY_DN752_c0_g1~~TRINITY_DN752_c0_g1_i1.p1  ORF type:complete len:897 (-),score=102.49 TRINITY_DN752_c0_g1_i1:34530-37220(-)